MAAIFLATLVTQIGAAWINNWRSKDHNEKMAKLQREYEEKVAREGMENARAEFSEMCALQRELEAEMQRDRLSRIRQNTADSMLQEAYKRSLQGWPLLVPPYVIANIPPALGPAEKQAIPLNCLLTTSNLPAFNRAVVCKIEEHLATFCSKYWNTAARKSIRFLQGTWRDQTQNIGTRYNDIYAHLKDVPMLLLSPVIKSNGTLVFRFYWWGLSTDPNDAHINDLSELDPQISLRIPEGRSLTAEEAEAVISECTPKLAAFISFFADLYYWNFYKEAPTLPALLGNGGVVLLENDKRDYAKTYCEDFPKIAGTESGKDLSEKLDYIESVLTLLQPEETVTLIRREIEEMEKAPILSVKDIKRAEEFSKEFGVSQMTELVNRHTTGETEEIQIFEDLEDLSDARIMSFVQAMRSDALWADTFAFINWSDHLIIGAFCQQDGSPCIFATSKTTRTFFLKSKGYDENEKTKESYMLNIIPLTMNKKEKEQRWSDRINQCVGQHFIDLGERMMRKSSPAPQQKSQPNPWSDDRPDEKDVIQGLVNAFIQGVDNGEIHYTSCPSDMGMADIIQWLKGLSKEERGNYNQVCIIKGFNDNANRVVYCALLVCDNKFDWDPAPKECFICKKESEEMEKAFDGKEIYVIPFEN